MAGSDGWKSGEHLDEAHLALEGFERSEESNSSWGLLGSALIHGLLAIEERLGQLISR